MTYSQGDVVEYLERQAEVVSLLIKGNSPTEIAKLTGYKRVEVNQLIQDWQVTARENKYVQERAQDAIVSADQHYSMILQDLWQVVADAKMLGETKLTKDSLLAVATVEEKRINMLQKAGLLDNQELASQLADQDRKIKAVAKLMREVAEEFPEARPKILEKMSAITGEAQAIEA